MKMPNLKALTSRDLIGVVVVIGSLALIAIVLSMVTAKQREYETQLTKSHGIGISRVFAGMSTDQAMPADNPMGILEVLRQSLPADEFAYAAFVDPVGNPVHRIVAPGTAMPPFLVALQPSEWLGERQIADSANGRSLTEYRAPLLNKGNLGGYLIIGLYDHEQGLSANQQAYLASIALLIFLLVPLIWFPLNRQFRKLTHISSSIHETLQQGDINKLEIEATGELGQFIRRFNDMVAASRQEIESITEERDQAQLSLTLLTYRREQIQTVLQSMPDGVIALDDSGKVTFMNGRALSLFGAEENVVLEQDIDQWCEDSGARSFLKSFDQQHRKPDYTRSHELVSPFAPDKTLLMSPCPLFKIGDTSELRGTLILVRDVTEEVLARKSRSEFVAHIAHELKTPLNVLSLYSEGLLDQGDSEEFRTEAVNVISDEVQRLSMLINNLLRLTRFEMNAMEIERTPIKLLDLLDDTFETVKRSADTKSLNYIKQLPKSMSTVHADKELLRIAITNLLTNAIKYSDEGDSITLSAHETDDDITIEVADTGIGIDEQEQALVFDKHFRSESEAARARPGHGLGLPLVKEIVESHHGRCLLESEVGTGSRFTIQFDKSTGFAEQAN